MKKTALVESAVSVSRLLGTILRSLVLIVQCMDIVDAMVVKLHEHQRKAVNELHNGAILVGDVGSGKTLTALSYYSEKEAPRNIYVITTAKKRDSLDWQSDAAKLGIGGTPESTVAGTLTVDSWNNIARYGDVHNAFFVFDEQRVVGSGSWVRSFVKIAKNNHWILLSATPGDTWLDYIPAFLANGYYKSRSEFLREHVVFNRWSKFPKVDRYLGVNKLVKLRNAMLVEMPLDRHTTRVTEKILVSYDEELMERVLKDRWHVYENRPLRDVSELFIVMRKVANSDSGRLRSLETLIAHHPKLIVFYNFDYELESLRKVLGELTLTPASTGSFSRSPMSDGEWKESASVATPPSPPSGSPKATGSTTSTTTSGSGSSAATATMTKSNPENGSSKNLPFAEWNGHKHQAIPTTDRWVYLVQYQAGAEGWNCIDTNAMCFYSLTYSYKNWHQAHGRIDRLNTPFSTLYYYVLLSNSVIDRAIWRALTEKRSFNEKRFLSTHSQKV